MCDQEGTLSAEEVECLKERKWWCFLLSSIFTFFAGIMLVLISRAFAFICCREKSNGYSAPGDQKSKEVVVQPGMPPPPMGPGGRAQQPEFEGTFMTEAKDWAGELISGQTTTGRILVRHGSLFIAVERLLQNWVFL